MNKIDIDIYCAPNCNRCGRAVSLVKRVLEDMQDNNIQYQKINVVDEIEAAVAIGVRATPAIVINGKLEFAATPNEQALVEKIVQELKR